MFCFILSCRAKGQYLLTVQYYWATAAFWQKPNTPSQPLLLYGALVSWEICDQCQYNGGPASQPALTKCYVFAVIAE